MQHGQRQQRLRQRRWSARSRRTPASRTRPRVLPAGPVAGHHARVLAERAASTPAAPRRPDGSDRCPESGGDRRRSHRGDDDPSASDRRRSSEAATPASGDARPGLTACRRRRWSTTRSRRFFSWWRCRCRSSPWPPSSACSSRRSRRRRRSRIRRSPTCRASRRRRRARPARPVDGARGGRVCAADVRVRALSSRLPTRPRRSPALTGRWPSGSSRAR